MGALNKSLGFKVGDDALNSIDHLSDKRIDSEIVAYTGPRQHYVREEPLHLHFRWFLIDRPVDGKDICARFQWLFDDVEGHFHRGATGGAGHARTVIKDQDGAVFVDVVQSMETPERVGGRIGLVSLVWLRELDCCECVKSDNGRPEMGGPTPRLPDSPISVKVRRILEDREVEVPLLLRQQRATTYGDGIEH